MKRLHNEKGIALVYLGLMLAVLLMIAGIAIDLSYMYNVKDALQVAADASALAGAGKLHDTQDEARHAAWKFACLNMPKSEASMSPLMAMSSVCNSPQPSALNNANSPDGDIVLGFWDGDAHAFTAGITEVNAVKAVTRRQGGSPNGPVTVFFGRVMGWKTMSASAHAIAALTPYATPGIAFCDEACALSMPANMVLQGTGTSGMAWTAFGDIPDVGANGNVIRHIKGEMTPSAAMCDTCIRATNEVGVAINELKAAFEDPAYRRRDKTMICDSYNKCTVTSWTVAVPVVSLKGSCPYSSSTSACPPGANPNDQFHVDQMAVVRITKVLDTAPQGVIIDQIDCNNNCTDYLYSNHVHLVK